jgi:hypothetical protein
MSAYLGSSWSGETALTDMRATIRVTDKFYRPHVPNELEEKNSEEQVKNVYQHK